MIYVVSQYYLPTSNPPANRMGYLVRWLVRTYGAENVRVVTGRPNYPDGILPPEFRWRLFKRRIGDFGEVIDHLYEFPAPFQGLYRKTFGLLTFALSVLIYLVFRRFRPGDLVFLTTGPIFPVYVAGVLARIKRKFRYVADVRDLWPQVVAGMGFLNERGRLYRSLMSLSDLSYRRAAALVGNSPGICGYLRSVAPSIPVSLLLNPVDTSFFVATTHSARREFRTQHADVFGPEDVFTFLFSGTYSNYLGIMTLLEALVRLQAAGLAFRFILIGQGEEEIRMRRFIETHKLEDHVTMLPFMARGELIKYIGAADACFASLGDAETLRYAIPTKIIEYLACGKTVVAAVAGPFAEMLKQANAAIVCPPGDPETLAEALKNVMLSGRGAKPSAEASAFVEKNFSLTRFEEGSREVFNQVL